MSPIAAAVKPVARAQHSLLVLGLLLGLLLLGTAACGQFEPRGAAGSCPGEAVFGTDNARECRANQATILVPDRPAGDRTAGGRLTGPPLAISSGRTLLHAVVMDYSGSMYTQCGLAAGSGRTFLWTLPGFAELLRDGLLGGVQEKDAVYSLAFNQQVLLLGEDGAIAYDPLENSFPANLPIAPRDPALALARLTAPNLGGTLPSNPFQAGFGDARTTRLDHVLPALETLFSGFDNRDGIAWVVTDNIIDSGDGPEPQLNQRFYERLESDARWQVVYAWPVHQAPWLCGKTLMVYGLYFSGRERIDEHEYHQLVDGQETAGRAGSPHARFNRPAQLALFERYASEKSPSPGQAFKLKPEYMDVVRLAFTSEIRCPPARVGQPRRCRAELEIENLLPHRTVESLQLELRNSRADAYGLHEESVHTAVPLCAGSVTAQAALSEPLAPRQKARIPVILDVGPVQTERHTLADTWENARHEVFSMFGAMQVQIRSLETAMVIEEAQLGPVYGVESLPAVFRNPSTDELATSICLRLDVHNPTHLASILLLLLLAVAVTAFLVGSWWLKPAYRELRVDDTLRGRVRLVRWGWTPLQVDGRPVARARLGLKGQPRVTGAPGFVVRRLGGAWESAEREGMGTAYRLELTPRRRRTASRSNDAF